MRCGCGPARQGCDVAAEVKRLRAGGRLHDRGQAPLNPQVHRRPIWIIHAAFLHRR